MSEEALGASHAAALSSSQHIQEHDRVPSTASHLAVSALVLQGPEIPGDQVKSKDFFLLLLFFSK